MVCSVGNAYPRYWEFTPALSDVGSKTLTVNVMNDACDVVATASTTVKVVNPVGSPASETFVLSMGDSLTDSKPWPLELQRRLCQTGGSPGGLGFGNITFIGNRQSTSNPQQRWIGYGGWTWGTFLGTERRIGYWIDCVHEMDGTDVSSLWLDQDGEQWRLDAIEPGRLKFLAYTGVLPPAPSELTWYSGGTHRDPIAYTALTQVPATPLWDEEAGKFSFAAFCQDYGFPKIDYVYVLLGWNGQSANKWSPESHAATLAQVRTFMDTLRAEYPAAQVRILGIQVPSPTGGLGANYGATGGYANYYKLIRTVHGLNLAYQNVCAESEYLSFARYIGVAAQFDSEWNHPMADTSVNSRNATKEKLGDNGVHPTTEGYYQIADAAFRDAVRSFCSGE